MLWPKDTHAVAAQQHEGKNALSYYTFIGVVLLYGNIKFPETPLAADKPPHLGRELTENMDTKDEAASREVLAFKLGQEGYGIDILKVQEIRGYEAVTRIANSPDFIKALSTYAA